MEHPGNIPTFNIPGTLFRNIRRNFIGNFFWIYQEYIVGMLHQYSTNRYLPGVCVCVCVYVCVCMFILFHQLISSGCMTSVTYMRCSEQRSFVVSITRGFCQVPSSPFLSLSYFTSKDENCSWQYTGEKTI